MKNLETPGKTGRVDRYVKVNLLNIFGFLLTRTPFPVDLEGIGLSKLQ